VKNLIFIILILIVFIRWESTKPIYKNGQRVRVTATLQNEPTISFGKQNFTIASLKVRLPMFPELHYGDQIVIEGDIKDGELVNANLKDYKETGNIFIKFRRALIDVYNKSLPAPHGALLAGITIGAKSDLPSDFINNLKNTGTTHVVVASGMNLTLLSGFVLALLLKVFRRRKAILLMFFVILIYCFISGFQAPIVRAAIMLCFVYLGQLTGRVYSAFRALLLSVLIMLVIVPTWITDVGFILSFATTASLILFGTKIDRLLRFVPGIFRESLSTSIAAQIGSSPII